METVNLPSVGRGLVGGLKPSPTLDSPKTFGASSTSYTVGVGGGGLFQKVVKKEEEDLEFSGFESNDTEVSSAGGGSSGFSTLNVELTADHVPLGEILERLQSDESNGSGDKNNFIRLHAVTDNSSSSTISATLNVATLNLSSHSSFQNQHSISEFHDVLFNMKSDPLPSPTSTSSSLLSSPSFSPNVVPEITTFLNHNNNNNNNNNLLSCDTHQGNNNNNNTSKNTSKLNGGNSSALSPHHYEGSKASPQECTLCNKMFGNASALAKHRLTHSDERKYLCTVCHKAFKRQDHLNGHLLTHRNKKPFECTAEGCNKSYCDARSLRRHRENHHSHKEDKLVSPASSGSSSFDNDDNKSLGSDTFDHLRNSKSNKLGLQLDKDKSPVKSESQGFTILEKYIRNEKHDNAYGNGRLKTGGAMSARNDAQEQSPNMVECTICLRRFKNIPALNGHMRLHGGYYRKDNEKKAETRPQPPVSVVHHVAESAVSNHTVSNNVKNLIEEKIIQKRKLEPLSQARDHQLQPTEPVSAEPEIQAQFSLSNACSSSASFSSPPAATLSSSPLASTSDPLEPPFKRINVNRLTPTHTAIPSLDNLVFPVLPQPDTSKLLANLQSKQTHLAGFLPAQPLPNVPLPTNKCSFSPVTKLASELQHQANKSAHINNLLKVDKEQSSREPRLGSDYQAILPPSPRELSSSTAEKEDKYGIAARETLMWSSDIDLPDTQLDAFVRFCLSSAVSAVLTAEEALQVLSRNNGDVMRASAEVMAYPWTKTDSSPASWSPDQVDMFYEALCKHKKNFVKISGDIPGKTVRDCVEFYYTWKNLCREESQSFKPIINSTEDMSSSFQL